MKKNSLKFHFLVYFSLFAAIILILLFVFQVLFLNRYYEWSKNKSMKTIANLVKISYNTRHYQSKLDMLSYRKDICIEITTDNSIYYSSDSVSRGCVFNDNRITEIAKYRDYFFSSDKKEINFEILNERYNTKILIYGVKLENDTYAFISTSLAPISSTVETLQQLLIYISLFLFILSFIVAYFLSKRISKPIEQLSETSKKLAQGNYDVVFETGDNISELNGLADSLNNMKEEFSKTDTIRKEMMANVSHDFKTPLTLIKANAEMVKDFSYNNEERRNANLNVIIDETDRLNLLVEDILELSKSQFKINDLSKEKFNLNKMIKSIINQYDVLQKTSDIKIIFNSKKEYFCYADTKRIQQVIYNLINNAVNYSVNSNEVNINLINKKNKVLFEIINRGNISKEDIKHIWDRYYKIDKSYQRSTKGTGLGLSIVKNYLELHNFEYGVKINDDKVIFFFEIDKYKGDYNGSKNVSESGKKVLNK